MSLEKKAEKQSHQNVIIAIWKALDDIIFFFFFSVFYIFYNKQLLLLKSESKTIIQSHNYAVCPSNFSSSMYPKK